MLQGITVLDLSQRFTGGYASLWLADLGAEVIRVEPVNDDSDYRNRNPKLQNLGFTYAATGRNKKSIAIDLKVERGKKLFKKLATKADVIIEGFRPGVTKRLGIDYESIKQVNESIIYASISGFGQTGSLRNEPGYDLNFQALSGFLSVNSTPDGKPHLSGLPLADIGAGLVSALSIVSALLKKKTLRKGTYIDLSISDVLFHFMSPSLMHYFAKGHTQFFTSGIYCCYNVYQCKDKRWIALAAVESRFWNNFCEAVERPDWKEHAFQEAKDGNKTFDELTNLFKQKTRDEWINQLEKLNTCISPVITEDEVWESPFVRERALTFFLSNGGNGRLPQVRLPIRLKDAEEDEEKLVPEGICGSFSESKYPPNHGEHTREILNSIGLLSDDIELLLVNKVIK